MNIKGVTNEQLSGVDNSPGYLENIINLTKDTSLKMRQPVTDEIIYDWQGTYGDFMEWAGTKEAGYILGSICKRHFRIITPEKYEFKLFFDPHSGPQLLLLPYIIPASPPDIS